MLDVGDRLIDAAPPFVKEFAIDTFGTNDKPALLIGIGVFLAVYAAVVGIVALRHRLVVGVVGIGLFGVIGVWAAASRRGRRRRGTPCCRACSAPLAGIGALVLVRSIVATGRPAAPAAGERPSPASAAGRRQFLHRSGALSARSPSVPALVGAVGRWLGQRFTATESRAAVRLPAAAERARRAAADGARSTSRA